MIINFDSLEMDELFNERKYIQIIKLYESEKSSDINSIYYSGLSYYKLSQYKKIT